MPLFGVQGAHNSGGDQLESGGWSGLSLTLIPETVLSFARTDLDFPPSNHFPDFPPGAVFYPVLLDSLA